MVRHDGASRRRAFELVVALVALGTTACSQGGPPTSPHALSSGRTIRIISVGQMHFSASGPALVLSYQTDLKVEQNEALRKEVADIWKDFRKEVDKAKLNDAIIMANEVPSGRVIQTGQSYNFVFARNADGSWPEEPSK